MTEKEPNRDNFLARITTILDQYDQHTHDVEEIRKYLFPINAAKDEQSQQQLDADLKAEYLAAVQANVKARRCYKEAAESTSSHTHDTDPSPRPASDNVAFLDRHFDLLRLREQNAKLTALKADVDTILSSSNWPAHARRTTAPIDPVFAPRRPEHASEGELPMSIMQSLQVLEVAVVRARHEAAQQKTLLDHAKSSIPEPSSASDEQHVAAMSVVRQILTTWLQQSLDICQEGPDLSNVMDAEDVLETEEGLEQQINIIYEQYVEARRQLLSAAANLRSPLLEKESATSVNEEPVERPFQPQAIDLFVNAIERGLLPAMHQQRMTYSHLTFMDDQLQKDSSSTVNMLDRLGDESQLLQAFPILARSGHFVHATSTFGDKQKQETEVDTKDEVSKRLQAWTFAAEAADVVSSGTVEKHLRQGKDAMDQVWRGLAAIQLLEETRT
ncbi:hypothetical protein Z517_12436 [Fonsecaea pedrosoi CBS 271.37]|uniref:Unplaced genomic scaffold supercont1.9, whole genome shotgun sequence n=1 Tax=Fonsecaea pedrosoi CBS 271.37 TaxID=1442368 RepID=A0A0D2DA97_9EURO|nr:uncharacterized protein Z517_12436 [Fonsecaea pedrosoi CBS 271.37]KIW74496.1 hypothetical protein Z517_12436 [Fonsecaea pedrosoi CBS 271.37]